jgi:hypothetical protein
MATDKRGVSALLLQRLEAQLTDSCGLIPYSQEWLHHWEQRI